MEQDEEVEETNPPLQAEGAAVQHSIAYACHEVHVPSGRHRTPTNSPAQGQSRLKLERMEAIWSSHEIVTRLRDEPSEIRVATFITCIGQRGLQIYNSLPFRSRQRGEAETVTCSCDI